MYKLKKKKIVISLGGDLCFYEEKIQAVLFVIKLSIKMFVTFEINFNFYFQNIQKIVFF